MNKDMTLTEGDEEEQDPTVLLWLNYFIAQHYKFKGDAVNALKYVDIAIAHTPTLLDLYTLKGKIYSMAGDRQKCRNLHEDARQLDTADRAINAISAMQMLKAGDYEGGLKTMNIFVSDCGYNVNVHDNQTIWFELQSGNCLYEQGRYREALKQWEHVERHVDHMVDDHADYLLYSFRRFTLQAFEELIVMMDDRLFQNRYVIKNAYNYIRLMHKVNKHREQEREKHAQATVLYK
jgi:peptide alpha-N-acetyltransferase